MSLLSAQAFMAPYRRQIKFGRSNGPDWMVRDGRSANVAEVAYAGI